MSPLLTALDLDFDLEVVSSESALEDVLPEDILRRLDLVFMLKITDEPTEDFRLPPVVPEH
jgi:hypothetical protein